MHNRIKSLLLRCIDVFSILVTIAIVIFVMISQGVVLTSVINVWKLDTYLELTTGVEIVFLLFTLLWLPLWLLVTYGKRR